MARFYGAPDQLAQRALAELDSSTRDLLVVLARVQSRLGYRFTETQVREMAEYAGVAPDPVLRAMGWGPRGHDMLTGGITSKAEDMAETAATALCWLARA